ncbi:MAG: hypothetical protein CVT49_10260 [candidate division Zixibacteria bacterium HGW-Zixibacteria-1]|nr:MAG: hypothetical protein CVT49_10260 [candidate division Zixibacteria bacterium HGW-Zixibacteria-1]
MRAESKIFVISILLGVVYWVTDTIIDHLIYYQESFWDLLILGLSAQEIYFRAFVLVVITIFGLIASRILRKRRLIETALRESEIRFRRTADYINDGLTIIESGRIVYVNDRACEIFGCPREELMKMDAPALAAPEERERLLHVIEESKLRGIFPDELRFWIVRKDGVRRYIRNRYSFSIESDVIIGRYVLTADITERKENEDALRSSEEQYRSTIDLLGDPLHVIDRNYNVVLVNQALLKWHKELGLDTDLVGRNLFSIYPFLPESVKKEYENIFKNGKTIVTHESTDLSRQEVITDTRKIAIYKDNRVERVITIIRDITAAKKAEDQLRKNEALLRATMDSLPFDFFAMDESGRYVLQNKTCLRNWGNIIGKLPEEVAPTEEIKELWRRNNSRALSGETVDEEVIYAINDEKKYIHNIIAPILDSDQTIGILGINMDITERKAAEQALRENKEKYSLLFHNSSDAIFIHDLDGNIIDVNKKTLQLFGCTREEMLKNKIEDIHPENMLPTAKAAFERVVRDGSVFFEIDFRKVNNDIFQAEVSSTLMELGGCRIVQGVVRDISARKRAAAALKESEERVRLAFDTSPDSILISQVNDGRLIQVNDGFTALTGYLKEEAEGKTSSDLNLWVDINDRQKLVNGLRKDGFVKNIEADFRKKDGSVVTALMSATIIYLKGVPHILTVTRDITNWKKAEEALRQSEEWFRTIFESAQDMIFIKDLNLRYVAANPAVGRLFGIDASELIGKSDHDLFGREASRRIALVDEKVLGGEIINEESSRPVCGEEKLVHVIKVPMRDADGQIIGLCGIARDITETRRLQNFALRAQRLETAGRIAGQVAHDFNNLLGPLVAFPELIKDELPENSRVIKYLNAMENSAQKIADINQQLLTLGRRAHYELTPLALNDIVKDVLAHIQPPSGNVKVVSRLAGDLMNIVGGGAQIHRVISNLVTNAYDAMEDGGTLTIQTENYYLDELAGGYENIPKGEYVKLTLADTGKGIPSKIVSKIFDPFFTTKATDKRRGSGLGLSVVHAVMEDHHGYIDLETKPERGTKFYLYFPVTRQEIESFQGDQIYGGEETIMVVDDDAEQRDVTAKLLEKLGYTVLMADSGEDAIQRIKENTIDLILMDMIMPPGIDGADTYKKILDLRPNQKAIIVSGFARSERAKYALDLGASGFLRKPVTLKSLAQAIRKALDNVPAVTTAT